MDHSLMDPCRRLWNPCHKLANNYTEVHDAAKNSSLRCGMLEKCILAVVDGKLPSVFRGAQDDADRARILDELVIGDRSPRPHGQQEQERDLKLRINGDWLEFELCRDPEQSNFTVKGIELKESARYGPTTNSDRALCNAKRWLRQCEDDHPDCGTQTPGYYPTRLLDLRGCRVKLIETGQTDIEGPYVCLSHRWGDGQHFQSTVRNIQNHMKDIPYDTLPKTFQHAVIVCRRLEVDYLWIDSLCILQMFEDISEDQEQKTKDDFVKENSSMAKTYRNSYFTICASVSTGMRSGMFSTEECSSYEIEVVNDADENAVFHIRGRGSHEDSPTKLETRGWTFQEYVLPSRILGFEAFDVSWKCRGNFTCECDKIREAYDWRLQLALYSQDLPDVDTAEDWWAKTVRYYSARELTYEQDKLPALSGLAQIYNNVTGDTYLAGIWKASLPHSLCWYYWRSPGVHSISLGRVSIGQRPKEFRAPSWSWASIDTPNGGECCFWYFDDRSQDNLQMARLDKVRETCTIYEATCELATSDPLGKVQGGSIKLGVLLIHARIDINNVGTRRRTESEKAWILEMAWTLSDFQGGWEVVICIPDCSLEACGLALEDEVFCAPILETSDEDADGFRIICLILKHLKGHEYQRIGFCILSSGDANQSDFDSEGEEVVSQSLQYTPEKGYHIVIV